MKLFILLLLPISLFSQGKLLRNQSLKLEMVRENNNWVIHAFNMNTCKSVIEINWDGIQMRSDSLHQFQSAFPVIIFAPQVMQFRNATDCANGSTAWLTMNTNRDIDKATHQFSAKTKLPYYECDQTTLPSDDTTIATKLPKAGVQNHYPGWHIVQRKP